MDNAATLQTPSPITLFNRHPDMAKDHEYLVQLRKEHAGGKVTVYRNRNWILQALSEGISKRAIYDALRENAKA